VDVSHTVKTRFLRARVCRRTRRWVEAQEQKERFWQTPEGKAQLAREEAERKAQHNDYVEAMKAERLAEKEAKRRKRADAFRKRIDAMTDDQRIAALRKQLENPKTPRQFIPSIEAKLRVLEQKLETVAGD
jgi:anion-transporting  ArsA/GET3 family ATPase